MSSDRTFPTPVDAEDYTRCRTGSILSDKNYFAPWWVEYVETDGWLEDLHAQWARLARRYSRPDAELPKRPQVDFEWTEYRGGAWRYRLDLNFRPFTVTHEMAPYYRDDDWSINIVKSLTQQEIFGYGRPCDFWQLCCLYAVQNRMIQRLARETDLIVRNRLRLMWKDNKLTNWDIVHCDTVPASKHQDYVKEHGIAGLLVRWCHPFPKPPSGSDT